MTDHSASVVSYLMEIYNSVAETLPDFRDDTWDVETSLVSGDVEDGDSYASLLAQKLADGPKADHDQGRLGKGRKTKIRRMRRSVKVTLERKPDSGGVYEDKWLPPGQMKDHWELYRHSQRGVECASFTTFWRDP